MDKEYQRPSPEAFLEMAKQEEPKKRGKLTIYFGAAPGVGKTYSMLLDARQRKQEGVDVVVGYVELHGRHKTEALLEGLEIIPPLAMKYKGVQLKEVDISKVIERKPRLVLIDELAHTDAQGLRYTRRYQDIEEILNAGIDVYTTMNVQHIESLNDVVYQITNVRVRETVPDSVLEKADEIKLIDLPPEELLKRLSEGEVYAGELAGRATKDFFRSGNLLALRQLALHTVARSVDDKMRLYMQTHAITGPWPVKEHVLVGVFASPYAEKLIRSAFRLASDSNTEWIALYVETEIHKNLSEQELEWLNKALALAKELGGKVVWIKGNDITDEIANYAKNNNITKIVIGKPRRFGLRTTVPRKILSKTPNIDIYLIDSKIKSNLISKKRLLFSNPLKYAVSVLMVTLVTLIAFFLRNALNETNLFLIMLVPVAISGIYLGMGASIFAAIISIIIFDYLFVPPYFTFVVDDAQYFVSFVIYIAVVITISMLASKLREKILLLRLSESKSIALYGLRQDLINVWDVEQLLSTLAHHATQILPAELVLFMPQNGIPTLAAKTPKFEVTKVDMEAVSWVWNNKQPAGYGTDTLPKTKGMYFPMMSAGKIIGILGLEPNSSNPFVSQDNRVILETLADFGATTLERIL